MYPLALCSVFSVAVILERCYALRKKQIIDPELANTIIDLPYGQNTSAIEQLGNNDHTVLSRLVQSCLQHMPWPKAENIEALQTKARAEVSEMERGLVVLEICTGIGPLLGLLGTVSGLITIFGNVGDTNLTTQGGAIARGISEALHCTVAGLVVAIPSLIAYSIFSKRVERLATELESLCIDLLVKLYAVKDGVETDSPALSFSASRR